MGMRTSDEPSVVGGQPASACSAPANILSQEEDEYRRAQLRREAPRRSRKGQIALFNARPAV